MQQGKEGYASRGVVVLKWQQAAGLGQGLGGHG